MPNLRVHPERLNLLEVWCLGLEATPISDLVGHHEGRSPTQSGLRSNCLGGGCTRVHPAAKKLRHAQQSECIGCCTAPAAREPGTVGMGDRGSEALWFNGLVVLCDAVLAT